MCAWRPPTSGHLELDPGYSHFYSTEPEEPSASHSSPAALGRAPGQMAHTWLPSIQQQQQPAQAAASEDAAAHHQQLGMQQQMDMQQQPKMQQQPDMRCHTQFPACTQQHPAASCMLPSVYSGSGQRRLHAVGAFTQFGLPSHRQAPTGTAPTPMDPPHFGGSALPAATPGLPAGFTSPVPPQHPQLSTPPRLHMRTALPPEAAAQLQSLIRAALGPMAFNSLRSLMLRQHSAYRQQLFDLHMLSQVQKLLMCETQLQVLPLGPSGTTLPPLGGLKRTAWQRDCERGRVIEEGQGIEGEEEEGGGGDCPSQRPCRRGNQSGDDAVSPQGIASDFVPVSYDTTVVFPSHKTK